MCMYYKHLFNDILCRIPSFLKVQALYVCQCYFSDWLSFAFVNVIILVDKIIDDKLAMVSYAIIKVTRKYQKSVIF